VHAFPHAHRHHEFLALGTDRIEPFDQELLLLIELRPASCDAFGASSCSEPLPVTPL
jgi:hypothetical protein